MDKRVVCLKDFGCERGLADAQCACRPSAGWPKEGQRFTPIGVEKDEDGEWFCFAEYLPKELFETKWFRYLDEVEKLEELVKEVKNDWVDVSFDEERFISQEVWESLP